VGRVEKKIPLNNHQLDAGVLVWDEELRYVLDLCLEALGFFRVQHMPLAPSGIGREHLTALSGCDILLVQAYNSMKSVRDAEGFRLGRTLVRLKMDVKPLVVFRDLAHDLLRFPCFIDYATFYEVDSKIEALLMAPLDDDPFFCAVKRYPELDRIPMHRRVVG